MIIRNFIKRRKPAITGTISIIRLGQKAILWNKPEVDFELVDINVMTRSDGTYTLHCRFEGHKVI